MVYGETKTFTKKQHKLEKLYERFIILYKAVKYAAFSIYLIFWSFYHITANIKINFGIIMGPFQKDSVGTQTGFYGSRN